MKIIMTLFLFGIITGSLVKAESLSKSELSELVISFFDSYEDQVREFQAQGGYLPDTAEAYLLLNRLEARNLAEEPSSLDDRLEAIGYLKRQVINVGIICAPGADSDVKELNTYRERVMSVYRALEIHEAQLRLNAKTQKEDL